MRYETPRAYLFVFLFGDRLRFLIVVDVTVWITKTKSRKLMILLHSRFMVSYMTTFARSLTSVVSILLILLPLNVEDILFLFFVIMSMIDFLFSLLFYIKLYKGFRLLYSLLLMLQKIVDALNAG